MQHIFCSAVNSHLYVLHSYTEMVRLAVDVTIAVADVFCEMKIELDLLSQLPFICKLYLVSLTHNTI
jgi:hypothetical protein